MRILLADDEKELSRAVSVILQHSGYEVDCAYDGAQAIEMLDAKDYDAFLLDIMMPKKNGIDVLRHIRSLGIDAPVIMLTAKAEVDDRINGLDAGANDYLTKPFAMGELLARIRAATRRLEEKTVINFGNLVLNKETKEITRRNSSYRLGNEEYEILLMLINAMRLEKDIEAERFIERIRSGEGDIDEVRLYISYLRKKMDALDSDMIIAKTAYDTYHLEKKT